MDLQKFFLLAATGAAVACSTLPSAAWSAELRTARKPIAGRYIVVLKPDIARLSNETGARALVPALAREIAASHRARLRHSYQRVLRGFAVEADDAALAKLLADPRVAYVEEDGKVSVAQFQAGATWGLDRIDQRNLPLDSTYRYSTTASNVHAYIIDSGVHPTHNEFIGRIGNGYSAINDGVGWGDCNGHGTHVAGILAGSTWGVAKSAIVHPVRVFDCAGNGNTSTLIAGIDWVAGNRQLPAVANMSLIAGASNAVDAAVDNLIRSGVVAVVAAGNFSDDACQYSPARVPNAITVGATDSNDNRGDYSNHGNCLDMFAPGSRIMSSFHYDNAAAGELTGTSMAAPHVAGAAALQLAINPTARPAEIANALIDASTPNKVGNPVAGSPNRLLYSLSVGTRKIFEQTDASGKVTIAVFERTSEEALGHNINFAIRVPDDYVVIGGGGEGKNAPEGNLLTASYPNANLTAWLVSTKDHLKADPVAVRGWAIGLKVAGLTPTQLRSNLTVTNATSSNTSTPDVTASLPSLGYVLVGGGFKVDGGDPGNMGTASAPSGSLGWRARSKDHVVVPSPATTTAYAIGLRRRILGVGRLESSVSSTLSGVANHPTATVSTPAGYALAGCGAFVNWSGVGSLLWQIQPMVVGGGRTGCSASAKDHIQQSTASIYGYAIGLRGF